jgi:hypothetical protein
MMKILKKAKRLLMILTVCLLTLGLAPTAQAAETAKAHGSIVIKYPVVGTQFDIYQVEEINEEGNRVWTEKFKDSSVNMDEKAAAETLYTYILRNNSQNEDEIKPIQTETIDENGSLTFTSLQKGTYLIVGQTVTVEGIKYTPSAVLLSDSQGEGFGSKWTVGSSPKYAKEEIPAVEDNPTIDLPPTENTVVQDPLPDTTTVSATKVWSDDDASTRPTSVNAQLLCDGEIYDTVTLSAENNWTHQWTFLARGRGECSGWI